MASAVDQSTPILENYDQNDRQNVQSKESHIKYGLLNEEALAMYEI
jgi:hypothetical protein